MNLTAIDKALAACDLAIDMAKEYSEEIEAPPKPPTSGYVSVQDYLKRQGLGGAWA